MMASFETALKFVLKNEGDLQDNIYDKGGITKKGISLRFLRSLSKDELQEFGIHEEPNENTIKELSDEKIYSIYKKTWWDKADFYKINNQNLCNYIFDAAINMGISPAVKCLQRACWSAWSDKNILIDDGILGEKTLRFINNSISTWHDILAAMRSERASDYKIIVLKHPEQDIHLNGWLNRSYNSVANL